MKKLVIDLENERLGAFDLTKKEIAQRKKDAAEEALRLASEQRALERRRELHKKLADAKASTAEMQEALAILLAP